MVIKGQDPIERVMGNTVERMTASELVAYMKMYLAEMYGIDMVVDSVVDRKTIEHFQKRYPNGKAGRIVQWVMLRHGGRKDGRYVTTSVFSTKMKWWTDMMWQELQEEQLREERRDSQRGEVDAGWFDLSKLGEQ